MFIHCRVNTESTSQGESTGDLQRQVDRLAGELLARGVRPTPHLLSLQLKTPSSAVKVALENWALGLSKGKSGISESPVTQTAERCVDDLQHGKGLDSLTSATVAAGLEAANRRGEILRIERRLELAAEIERARIALEKMESRRLKGDPPAHLVEAINKARARLMRMQAALEEWPPATHLTR